MHGRGTRNPAQRRSAPRPFLEAMPCRAGT
jgi:hypothetical protein